jgi:hypothetical protein
MHFLRGFSSEITKTAGPSLGRIAKMMRIARRGEHSGEGLRGMTLGKGLLLGGGLGAAGGAIGEVAGKKRGERQGYEEGTSDVSQVAQRARLIGRQEGIMAYHQALQAKLRGE